MTRVRSRAYGRSVRALGAPGALRTLTSDQRDVLRDATDTLVLAPASDGATRTALAVVRAVLLSIPLERRAPWLEQLADDLEDTGPPQPLAPRAFNERCRLLGQPLITQHPRPR